MDYLSQKSSTQKTPPALAPQKKYKLSPLTNRLLIKYVHQDLDKCLDIRLADIPNST